MARKILIIFALIIAVFPYLGFSDSTDNIVITILALLIALALLFSRKPKTIQNKDNTAPKTDMPSPFSVKMQDIPKSSDSEIELKPKMFNQVEKEEVVKISHDSDDSFIVNNSDTSANVQTISKPVRRRVTQKVHEEIPIIESKEIIVEDKIEVAPRRRSPRRIVNSILANEESVPPADIPTRVE